MLNISVLAQQLAAKAYVWTILFLPAPTFRQEEVSGAKKPQIVIFVRKFWPVLFF